MILAGSTKPLVLEWLRQFSFHTESRTSTKQLLSVRIVPLSVSVWNLRSLIRSNMVFGEGWEYEQGIVSVDKEERLANVARRFDCKNDYQSRSTAVSDLQGTSGEIEQPTPQSEGDSNKADFWTKVSGALFVGYMCFEMYRVLNRDDLLKANVLFYTQKALKAGALMLGTAALLVEKQYNDHMSTLH